MNKSLVYVVLLVIIAVSGALWLRPTTTQRTPAPLPVTPTSFSTVQDTLLNDIAKELSRKYDKPADAYVLKVDKESGSYAKGSVTAMGEGGGGLWYAVNGGGVWKLVYDGNGILTCNDIKAYPDFPSSLIPQCFDDNTKVLIQR